MNLTVPPPMVNFKPSFLRGNGLEHIITFVSNHKSPPRVRVDWRQLSLPLAVINYMLIYTKKQTNFSFNFVDSNF